MTNHPAVDSLTDLIHRLRTPKHHYDRAEELNQAALFVAEFGSFADIFDGADLANAQTWDGDTHAAWWMLAHWSVERGDPDPQSTVPDDHCDVCDVCAYLEDVLGLRQIFATEVCHDCCGDLVDHDLGLDPVGYVRAYCRQMWTRAEPAAAPGGDGGDNQIGESWNARWFARLSDGNYALITHTFYLADELDDEGCATGRDEHMAVEIEYRVSASLTDGDVASEYLSLRLENPDSMDPREMALNAPDPVAGEWQEHAPHGYGDLLVSAVPATV